MTWEAARGGGWDRQGRHGIARYLISSDDGAMNSPQEELPAADEAAHAVVRAAQEAGVWIFCGGGDSQRASIVATDGTVTTAQYRRRRRSSAGSDGRRALARGGAPVGCRVRRRCRCAQEVRETMFDPSSHRRRPAPARAWLPLVAPNIKPAHRLESVIRRTCPAGERPSSVDHCRTAPPLQDPCQGGADVVVRAATTAL